MSSAGGGSGVGGGAAMQKPQQFTVVDGSNVKLASGVQVDLSTAEGVAKAEAELDAGDLEELNNSMRSVGYRREGKTFVHADDYELRKELGVVGPTDITSEMTDLDAEIGEKVFEPLGIPNPYNANTTEQTFSLIGSSQEFIAAQSAMSNVLTNPTNANIGDFMSRFAELEAKFPNGNIMEVLFLVFRESIKETNEDKKYFLMKLQEFNKMAEAISAYLSELVERSQALGVASEGQKYPEKVHINVECKTFDLSTLDPNGKLVQTSAQTKSLDRASLNDTIKDVESMQETVRNKRQMASTAFQNFDQKANQLYNLMSSVLKSLNEMRSGTTRNML